MALPLQFFALVAVALLVASPLRADSNTRAVQVIDYGIYKVGGVRVVAMPKSVSGRMNLVSRTKLVRKTRTLAAQPNRSFGFRFRYIGLPAGTRIKVRTIHPPLTNPKTGKTMRSSERWHKVGPGGERYIGYSFDYTWEMAEGTWAFQLVHQGRVLTEQKFKILVPLN